MGAQRRSILEISLGFLLIAQLAGTSACGTRRVGSIGSILARKPGGRVFVRDTPAEGAGARAGLYPDDEILRIDGKRVEKLDEAALREALRGAPGSTVRLVVYRDGEQRTVVVTREALPEAPEKKK